MQRKYWLGLFLAAAALLFLFFSATLLFFYLIPSSPTASPFPQHHALRLLAFQHILLEPRVLSSSLLPPFLKHLLSLSNITTTSFSIFKHMLCVYVCIIALYEQYFNIKMRFRR